MSIVGFLQRRFWSSSSKPARKYLENWVGASNSALDTVNSSASPNDVNVVKLHAPSSAYSNLVLSGTSYLLPTLRIERKDSPTSLFERLRGESNDRYHRQQQQPMLASSWRCPIVLDLSALSPDGSPHYQPPPTGYLMDMVSVLAQHGVDVLGITAARPLPATLEKEAAQLPYLGPCRSARSKSNKLDLLDVIRFVSQRNKVSSRDNEASASVESPTSPQLQETEATVHHNAQNDPESSDRTGRLSDLVKPETKDITATFESDTELTVASDDNQSTTNHSFASILATTSPTVYHGSVRSGQQISSEKGRSLLILGSVSSGGEVMADGDIYIFGKLRGRALAGLGQAGNNDHLSPTTSPRIVATTFDPELVCIGGVFTTIDSVEDFGLMPNQSAMVTLEKGTLMFQAI